jgi:DNA-directed RNA polymerase subunit K/omega
MPATPVDIYKLAAKADNIYEAIVVMSKRARQINEEIKIEYNQRIEAIQSQLTEAEEDNDQPTANPDQINIAKDFESRPKPTEIAIKEMFEDKLSFRYKENAEPLTPRE